MIKKVALAGMLVLFSLASAKGPYKKQTADPKRVTSIWDAANQRIARQGDAWFKNGDYPRVVQLLRFQYALDPTDFDIATNLGWMLENVDQYDQALAVYVQLRTNNPNQPDDAWPEANFYFKKKAYAKIPPILEPTIKDHDPHGNTYRTLAHAYERLNMLADSKRVWELFLSKHPDDGPAKANLDRVLKKLKEGSSKKT